MDCTSLRGESGLLGSLNQRWVCWCHGWVSLAPGCTTWNCTGSPTYAFGIRLSESTVIVPSASARVSLPSSPKTHDCRCDSSPMHLAPGSVTTLSSSGTYPSQKWSVGLNTLPLGSVMVFAVPDGFSGVLVPRCSRDRTSTRL